jgi:polyisoprenyl-teichoic acid--peptidoglycan teichoic acid transferase
MSSLTQKRQRIAVAISILETTNLSMPSEISLPPEDENQTHTQEEILRKEKTQRHLFLLANFATISCIMGACCVLLMIIKPLRGSNSKPSSNSSTSLESLVAAKLDKPLNILFLGIDNSGHAHTSKFTPREALSGNSDTMLLARLIPSKRQINILSIPRDTLVQIPGIGTDKINDANAVGGTELAIKTVSHLLADISIDRYVRLDTEGFIKLVDALGGVTVTVPKKMDYVDHTQNLSISFDAGRQKLSGQHLEEYVRFRHDALGDISRVQRQQAVLKEILHTFWQPSTIVHLPKLLQIVKENVDSDLSVGEMLSITQFLSHIDQQHINMVMLPGRFSEKSEYKLSYWIENSKATAPILNTYFGVKSDKLSIKLDLSSNFKQIRVAVANATGEPQQAVKTLAFLERQGFDNSFITNHEINSGTVPLSQTQIIAQLGNVKAANAVREVLGVGQVQVVSTGDISSDVTVVLGTDFAKQ